MRCSRSILISTCIPPSIGGTLAAAWLLWNRVSIWHALIVIAAGVVAGIVSAGRLARQEQSAEARLRHPELRGTRSGEVGVFQTVVEEAVCQLGKLETQTGEAIRQRTEAEVRAQVRQRQIDRFTAAFQQIDDAVLIVNDSDQMQYANPSAERLFRLITNAPGHTDECVIPNLEFFPPLRRLVAETRERSAANDRRSAEFDVETADQTLALRATAIMVNSADGTPLGVVAILREIADERMADTRHAEFVSSASHELKTPLASIRAFTELLIDGDVEDPDEQRELFGFIEAQVDRLTRMVNNMLNLARIESGVITVRREDLELNDVLQKSLDVLQPVAEEKEIKIVRELSELYLPVHIDSDLFGQAMINLLSNAVKYTPNGGEVRLRSRMDENQAVIEVRDSGMGIPEESLPRLFERFYRVPQNNVAAAGTGLGLALVHYIITDIHNGDIQVSSVVTKGSCFTARIPLGHRNNIRRKLESEPVSV